VRQGGNGGSPTEAKDIMLRRLRKWRKNGLNSAPQVHDDYSSCGEQGGELYRLFRESADGDLHKWHHYFAIYERYFSRFRGKPISILEIGVARGGSVRLWRRYFGPQVRITGIDRDPGCARQAGEGIEIFIGDQADADFLMKVARERGPFDIVIDDGGHTTRQQLVSFETLLPQVQDGGVYLVEDLHTNLWAPFFDHALGVSFLDVASRMAEKLTWWHKDESSFERYGKPHGERKGSVEVPSITRSIFSVAFYDSVVVFEKQAISEPRHEIR
jgi:23S rRNA U2552 (ribose-2'-O)-methylase RlmE/FtsJ